MRSGSVEGVEYAFGLVLLPVGWSFPSSALAVQLVDPARVYGDRHLLVSICSHLKGLRLAKDAGIDLLLRITGETRITEAMKAAPTKEAVMVVVGPGAAKEYARLVKSLKAKDAGDVVSRAGEDDAAERSALAGI